MKSTGSLSTVYHIPALLKEAIHYLDIKPGGTYVDATFGGGGHSRAIMAELGEEGKLFSFDRDLDAYANRIEDKRFTFVHANFRHLENFMRFYGAGKVDGILADLGVSFHHFDSAERGFSFRNDAPLDMRMNQKAELNAAGILADADEAELSRILRDYADLRNTSAVVKAILAAQAEKPIETTGELAEAVRKALDPRAEKKELAQVFQAFRIETNREDEDLRRFLLATLKGLKPGGRLVVLTYHSVEDRMVKNFMKAGNFTGIEEKDFFGKINTPWKVLTKKPVEPSKEEVEANPRSRSAKLRAAELKD